MKKSIFLLFAGLLMAIMTQAQTTETLTNSSVIRMLKANLAEELIIDVIKTSPGNYDLSENAVRTLESEGVSGKVIEAMKNAGKISNEVATEEKTEEQIIKEPVKEEPQPKQVIATNPGLPDAFNERPALPEVETKTITLEALNYTSPLTELAQFNEKEYNSLVQIITEWNKQIVSDINDVNKAKSQIIQTENEMRQKKNADTKAFDQELLSLKTKLSAYRGKYEQTKAKILKDGQVIIKKAETLRSDRTGSLGKAYSNAISKIGSSGTDPSQGQKASSFTYTTVQLNPYLTDHVIYLTDMLAWYQNEILKLNEVIKTWNPRVEAVIAEDLRLSNQLKPLEIRLEELKENSKQNKTEINSLKKQVSDIEKQRKKLADKMEDDSKELADYIKKLSQENQESVKQRFTDIIENMTYSFQQKLSL